MKTIDRLAVAITGFLCMMLVLFSHFLTIASKIALADA